MRLAASAYEMLSGQAAIFRRQLRPDLGSTPPRGAASDCATPASIAPTGLKSSCSQLLEKEPHKRPFNARAVQGVIRQHLASDQ